MKDTDNWSRLTDANGDPYDPRRALKIIESDAPERGYDELWERAHHQGDLGTAASAVVPELVRLMTQRAEPDWRAYALIATIDERRKAQANPPVPDWLRSSYEAAMREVIEPALAHLLDAKDDADVRSLLAVLARAKGQRSLGAIALWTDDEQREALGEL